MSVNPGSIPSSPGFTRLHPGNHALRACRSTFFPIAVVIPRRETEPLRSILNMAGRTEHSIPGWNTRKKEGGRERESFSLPFISHMIETRISKSRFNRVHRGDGDRGG
ncbi:MAG: hypothetical protein ACTSUE_17245 [Promethearchaeota archaeon]